VVVAGNGQGNPRGLETAGRYSRSLVERIDPGDSRQFCRPSAAMVRAEQLWISSVRPRQIGKAGDHYRRYVSFGLGREEDLPTFNATTLSIEEGASAFNDLVYPVNDTSTMQVKREDIYAQLKNLTYGFGEGKERGRSASSKNQDEAAFGDFKGILFISGERSLSSYAALRGQMRDSGEAVRLIDLPFLSGERQRVFDRASRLLRNDLALIERPRTA
jgi:hypothetical protein